MSNYHPVADIALCDLASSELSGTSQNCIDLHNSRFQRNQASESSQETVVPIWEEIKLRSVMEPLYIDDIVLVTKPIDKVNLKSMIIWQTSESIRYKSE